MTDSALYHRSLDARASSHLLWAQLPFVIVAGCTLFNFFLCFVNTHVFAVSNPIIIACEMVLIGSAVALGFRGLNRPKLFWLGVIAFYLAMMVVISVAKGVPLVKPMRDFLIMPVFLTLGLAAFAADIRKPLYALLGVVLLCALLEAFATETFLEIFNFKQYFIAKGAMEDLFWVKMNTFASGSRPNGRFLFDLEGIHRISSVFLEPVSLGFFAAIVGFFLVATRYEIRRAEYAAALIVCFGLIWLSDGRMAFGSLLATMVFAPVFVRLDHRFSLLIFPIALLSAYVAYAAGMLSPVGEGVGARLWVTMENTNFDSLPMYLGLEFPGYVADSGIADMIFNQGVIAVLLFWAAPVLFMHKVPPEARIYIWGSQIYLTLGLLVSPAIFSIKTGALWWFLLGYLLSADRRRAYQTSISGVPRTATA